MQANITQLLQNTLNPSLLGQAQNTLLSSRTHEGFVTNLLIIGDDSNLSMAIRQSALIYLKNALFDDNKDIIRIPDNDFQTIKSSILPALIRNCSQKSLTPTLREIIYIVSQNCFPDQWHQIIPYIANVLQNSSDFSELYGSIEGLKAIVSSIGKRIDQKLTIQNLSNKIVLPLLGLASKLFQNYNQTTSFILISIFKIFSTLTNFLIPEIIVLNMHSWMIFIKKLLDLNIESGNIDQNMYQLKKICLRIMYRFYQRHMNSKFSDLSKNIIKDFHQKFTKGIVESLLLQIINEAQMSKNPTNKNYIQLTKFSLACLSYVYEEDRNAATIIDNYKDKIIYLCLERYKVSFSKGYSSYGQFAWKLEEQRVHFCKFIKALINNPTRFAQQNYKGNYDYSNQSEINSILGSLYGHIEKGDIEMKELCLYIYGDIAQVLPDDDTDIQSKMLAFILTIVNPLLNDSETPTIIKLRCCQILSKYPSIHIPENELSSIAGGVYGCLVSNQNRPQSGSMQTFLQIHAVRAFNSLLRYDYIVNFTSPSLDKILLVYTSLLETQVSIIKCLQDMLSKYENYLQPYGNNLIEMLTGMYFKYNQLVIQSKSIETKHNKKNVIIKQQKAQQEEEDEDDQSQQHADNNFLNASKACLGAIRQIIQAPHFKFERDQLIHNLLISIFSDKEQLHTEEGFNILNQVLFKQKQIKPEYNLYFSVIIFGFLPLNQNYINKLKSQNTNYANALLKMLEVLSGDPDQDFIQNTIGCLRNFISKYQQRLRDQIDSSGMSFLESILTAVKFVHENQSSKATQTDRSIILTLYISLIEWNAVNDLELKQILNNVGSWLRMEKQSCQNNMDNSKSKLSYQQRTSVRQQQKKTVYCPIYIQIILLACHFNPNVTLEIMNGNWIANQLIQNWQRFHCDYELTRIIIGISDLLKYQSITDKATSCQIINRLPEIIQKQCKIRVGEDNNDVKSQGDQAQQQKMFGPDQNSHIMDWKNKTVPQGANQQQNVMEQQDSQEQEQQQEQFNKYYQSPLDSIDEISYALNILKDGNCQMYMNLMRTDVQQRLSFLFNNAPSKFPPNNN